MLRGGGDTASSPILSESAVKLSLAAMRHYYAIAERCPGGGWFLTFPGGPGDSYADNAEQIVAQAQDWLADAAEAGHLPPAVEEGASLPTNLAEFDQPAMVVVIPFELAISKAAA